MNGELFNSIFSRFSNEVSEEHLLSDIANQVRLLKVRQLQGYPVVTPYDVFRSYRDQNERIGAKLVEVPVDSFLDKVPEPSASDIQALFDQYKDTLPDPTRETPGFKIPRQIQLEILSIDGNALARGIRDKLTEADLRSYYENHKSEFEVPSELPTDLFAGQPDLTPADHPVVRRCPRHPGARLAEERAQAEMTEKFTKIKEEEMIPFAEKYLGVLDELEDAKKPGGTAQPHVALPTPKDLKPLADREGMVYEKTGLLSREDAERLRPDRHRRGWPERAERRTQVHRRGLRPQDRALRADRADRHPGNPVPGPQDRRPAAARAHPGAGSLRRRPRLEEGQGPPPGREGRRRPGQADQGQGVTPQGLPVRDLPRRHHPSDHAVPDELPADLDVRAQPPGREPHP